MDMMNISLSLYRKWIEDEIRKCVEDIEFALYGAKQNSISIPVVEAELSTYRKCLSRLDSLRLRG